MLHQESARKKSCSVFIVRHVGVNGGITAKKILLEFNVRQTSSGVLRTECEKCGEVSYWMAIMNVIRKDI